MKSRGSTGRSKSHYRINEKEHLHMSHEYDMRYMNVWNTCIFCELYEMHDAIYATTYYVCLYGGGIIH